MAILCRQDDMSTPAKIFGPPGPRHRDLVPALGSRGRRVGPPGDGRPLCPGPGLWVRLHPRRGHAAGRVLRQRSHGPRHGRPAPASERLLHRARLGAPHGAARPLRPGS
eukprot:6231883-Alexandrium_andersonii.AAC.1